MILHHLWEASSFQCLLNCVCGRFTLFFFLFLVFLMIIFCRMPLINLNLGISIKLTKLSWPFFPRIFSFSDTWAFGRSKVPLELPPWQTNHAPFDWHVIHLRKARWNGSGLVMDLPMALTPNALLNLVYMDSASRPESYDAFIKRWNSGFLWVVNQFVSLVFIKKKNMKLYSKNILVMVGLWLPLRVVNPFFSWICRESPLLHLPWENPLPRIFFF